MNVCGIMVSKEKSTRFPHKNRKLFEQNLNILIDVCGKNNVYMFTDDAVIAEKCKENGVAIIPKTENFDDEFCYLDALRFTFFSIEKKYDYIVSMQCDSIGHKKESVIDAIEKLKNDNHASECRAFDCNGKQSGFFVFKSEKLPDKWYHMCAVVSDGREIHYEMEL